MDGEHKAWFVLEVNNKDEAIMVVPPYYRKDTKVTKLSKFNLKEVENMLAQH
jgi:hypothetical protein